jgi:4-hydroxy-tetrahydrodipicolinate synthase
MAAAQIEFEGTYTALVTPFREDESIDWPAYERLLEAQVAGGVAGVVPCGTTGESPALDEDEQHELIKRAVDVTCNRALVVAGIGSNSTRGALRLAERAQRAGAHAIMVVVPYYNKPTQAGLQHHFVTVAKSVSCPVVLYNIPGRCGVDLTCDTLLSIFEAAPNVRVTKEATGNVLRGQEIIRRSQNAITVLSGDDALTVAMMAVGARGVISVTSNILPKEVSAVTTFALASDFAAARHAHMQLLPIHEAMFVEANPGPVKVALAASAMMRETMRAPLVPVGDHNRKHVLRSLSEFR